MGGTRMMPAFLGGFAAAFVALALFRRRLSRPLGALSRRQRLAMPAAIVLELALVAIVLHLFQPELAQGQTRNCIFAILFAVGIHFTVFAISSGPLCLLLAALCCGNALAGLLAPAIPLELLWILDGLMKLGVGIAMLRTAVPAVITADANPLAV